MGTGQKQICQVCMHHCELEEGQTGRCHARQHTDGAVQSLNYGEIVGPALDPIEKKPLQRFYPGSQILSVGSFGCNMNCWFCQNHSISQTGKEGAETVHMTPQELCEAAKAAVDEGNIGLAFTYNEPTIGWEFIRDTAKLVHEAGMQNVLVTNGSCSAEVLDELLPYIDAMNIDLKCFTEEKYRELGGSLEQVKRFIRQAYPACHIELTNLLVPEFNDSEEEFVQMCEWIASIDRKIPLHVTRYFPFYHPKHRWPTSVDTMYHFIDTAKKYLEYVYSGNL